MLAKRTLIGAAGATTRVSMLPRGALAQTDYPTRPIKLILPFPAGGTGHVMGRLPSDELGKALKQPVIVENIGGADAPTIDESSYKGFAP